MKKTILILVAAFFLGISVNAQDIITLKNGDDIQALVQEIGIDDVKYKRFDNPNGPNYTLKKSEIFMIRYANGSRDVFAETAVPSSQLSVQSQATQQSETRYVGGNLQLHDDFLRIKRSDKEWETHLRDSGHELYSRFRKGQNFSGVGKGLRIPGWICFGSGLGIIILGVAVEDYEATSIGAGFFVVGGTLILVSIPFSAVGNGLKNSVKTQYKIMHQGRASVQGELQFHVKSNGIGLTYVF